MPSAWIEHVKKTYQAGKAKGMSYKAAMIAAKKTYKRGGKAAKAKAEPEEEVEEKPRKRRRKKKAQ